MIFGPVSKPELISDTEIIAILSIIYQGKVNTLSRVVRFWDKLSLVTGDSKCQCGLLLD